MISLECDEVGFKRTYIQETMVSVLKGGGKTGKTLNQIINIVLNVRTSKMKNLEKLLSEIGASELVLQFYRNALPKCVLMNEKEIARDYR